MSKRSEPQEAESREGQVIFPEAAKILTGHIPEAMTFYYVKAAFEARRKNQHSSDQSQ